MSNVDFAVLNALNLINPRLGKAYEENGKHPFDGDFNLTREQVLRFLELKTDKKQIEVPAFLEKGTEELKQVVLKARRRALSLAVKIQEEALKEEASKNMADNACVFKLAALLLETIDLNKLSYEEILDAFQTIMTLGGDFSHILKKLFDKNFQMQIAVRDFAKLCAEFKTTAILNDDKKDKIASRVHETAPIFAPIRISNPNLTKEVSLEQ